VPSRVDNQQKEKERPLRLVLLRVAYYPLMESMQIKGQTEATPTSALHMMDGVWTRNTVWLYPCTKANHGGQLHTNHSHTTADLIATK
jgi:hypothetical protein